MNDYSNKTEMILLTTDMLLAAKLAEEEHKEGKSIDMNGFNKRFAKWNTNHLHL